MKNKEVLLSCPFCGSDKACVYRWNVSSHWSVSCQNNNCPLNHSLDNLFDSKESAVRFWNTRYSKKFDESFHIKEDND